MQTYYKQAVNILFVLTLALLIYRVADSVNRTQNSVSVSQESREIQTTELSYGSLE